MKWEWGTASTRQEPFEACESGRVSSFMKWEWGTASARQEPFEACESGRANSFMKWEWGTASIRQEPFEACESGKANSFMKWKWGTTSARQEPFEACESGRVGVAIAINLNVEHSTEVFSDFSQSHQDNSWEVADETVVAFIQSFPVHHLPTVPQYTSSAQDTCSQLSEATENLLLQEL
jgi:hypothetical protein